MTSFVSKFKEVKREYYLQELFKKYSCDYEQYKHYRKNLKKHLKNCDNITLEFRGHEMGIVIVDLINDNITSLGLYSNEYLLNTKVIISSWNKYTWYKKWTEEEIVQDLFEIEYKNKY